MTAHGYLPFVHLDRARLAAWRGDGGAQAHHLGEAQRLFVAMGAPARAEQVAQELAPTSSAARSPRA